MSGEIVHEYAEFLSETLRVVAPSNPTPTPKPPMTPEQQKKAVCDQAANVTRNLSGVRTAGVVIAAAGAVCIGATGGGWAK